MVEAVNKKKLGELIKSAVKYTKFNTTATLKGQLHSYQHYAEVSRIAWVCPISTLRLLLHATHSS